MKKNLFGAVSAALALALAITSFGCESGNDSPIRAVTDADRAALDKATFKYVATPNEYTPAGTTRETPSGTDSTTGYDWVSYVNGTLAYNRKSDSAAKSATVKGTEVGDVIKTKKETVTLDVNAGTWSKLAEATSLEVFALVDHTATGTTANCTLTSKAVQISEDYDATHRVIAIAAGTLSGTYSPSVITPGYITTYNGANGYADVKAKFDNVIDTIKALKSDYVTSAAIKDANKAIDDDIEALNLELAYIDAKWHGATKVIVSTDAANTKTTKFVDDNGKEVIPAIVKKGTAPEAVTGKYTLLSGNYKTGSILLTTWNKVTFDDANDAYVTDAGYKGKISVTYPVASTTRVGALGQKDSRILTIANGVLTAPKILVTQSDAVDPNRQFGFILGASTTAYYDNTAIGKHATARDEYQSYSYKLQ